MQKLLTLLSLLLFRLSVVSGQPVSPYPVTYMVSYDAGTGQYTAWVVPGYSTPNANNTDQTERGATAQFTLKVPASFSLSQVSDVTGNWSKQPLRIAVDQRLQAAGGDPAYAFYVIGKTVEETGYGPFKAGEPVALFRFTGAGGKPQAVQVLDRQDPFIQLTDRLLSLNIGSSFYSRSGQSASATARPMEQFSGVSTVQLVLSYQEKQTIPGSGDALKGTDSITPLFLYPNPTPDEVQVKVFRQGSAGAVRLELTDSQGKRLQSMKPVAQSGFSVFVLKLGQLAAGTYTLSAEIDGKSYTRQLVKL